MKIDFLNIVSLEEAIKKIKDLTGEYSQLKEMYTRVNLVDTLGKTVYETISSPFDLPEFNRSTVDGYALRVADIQGASESIPGILTILGEVTMGNPSTVQVTEGTCVYVPTGGMVPEGANAMVMIEDTEKMDEDTLLIYKQVKYGDFISYKGDDVKSGEVLIESGKRMTAYDVALLAGLGISKVNITTEPIFTVLSTGDEIVDIEDECKSGMVRDINGYGVAAWINEKGGLVKRKEIIKDNFESLKETLEKSLADSDVIILSGGSSMGTRDYTKSLIESFSNGNVIYHGLAAKPGKPTIIGTIGKKLIFGLPGHPVAALVVCQNLVGAFMEQWFHHKQEKLMIEAVISENIHGAPGRDMFQMVKLIRDNDCYIAKPIYGKSGLISTLAGASGWVKICKETEGVFAGEQVIVELLQEVRF